MLATITAKQAIALQRELAEKVRIENLTKSLRYIAGLDCAFSRDKTTCLAACVLWDKQEKQIVEITTAAMPLEFPYIPGLLSFREAPTMLTAFKKLNHKVDAILVDGHGLAHPRQFGIACHIGVETNLPTIGCAKSRLVGDHIAPKTTRGSTAHLTYKNNIIGQVVTTRNKVKPVYISIGHLIDLNTAVTTILECSAGLRLPEPTRLADRKVAEFKRQLEI
ncbi:MAG: deoxyribonuclease V [Pseudomonadota bacterium]